MPARRGFFDYLLERADAVQVLHFLLRPRTRWLLSWLLVLGFTGFIVVQGWMAFNRGDRRDGNLGHTSIDFGGQWIMGRMIVEGQGRSLYHRNALRPVLEKAYPAGDGDPKAENSDADALMIWLAGSDDEQAPKIIASFLTPLAARDGTDAVVLLAATQTTWTEERLQHATTPRIGGALYPPIHALCYAPLGSLPPRIAYRLVQGLIVVVVFLSGWVIERMTEGRIWWPMALVFIYLFPGFTGCIALGQNGMFTFALVLLGWWQLMRGREGLAGFFWGLLAFKPVWAAAFVWVPLVTGRWRMAGSMIVTGLAQIVLTLPVVGWQSWLDWLHIGRVSSYEYLRQENWIFLSRDLLGIPRRWLLHFEDGLATRLVWQSEATPGAEEHPLLALLGWGLWSVVLAFTLGLLWRCRRQRQALTGPLPAFVLIGAIFTCYHFMYYDFLVAGLPVLLLFTDPALARLPKRER
jgi:hypothetical protein